MLKDLIRIQLSTKELTYQPGGIPATFEIALNNQRIFRNVSYG